MVIWGGKEVMQPPSYSPEQIDGSLDDVSGARLHLSDAQQIAIGIQIAQLIDCEPPDVTVLSAAYEGDGWFLRVQADPGGDPSIPDYLLRLVNGSNQVVPLDESTAGPISVEFLPSSISREFDEIARQLQQTGNFSMEFTEEQFARMLKGISSDFYEGFHISELTITEGQAVICGDCQTIDGDVIGFTLPLVNAPADGVPPVIEVDPAIDDVVLNPFGGGIQMWVNTAVFGQLHRRRIHLPFGKDIGAEFTDEGTLRIRSVDVPK